MHLYKNLSTIVVVLILGFATTSDAQTFWSWPTETDPYADSALLDLRNLNEDMAGDLGWVYREDEKLYFGNGKEARFWSINLRDWGSFSDAQLRNLARLSAKRGVNMVRTLGRVYDLNGTAAGSVRSNSIAHTQRSVRAFKEAGIYSSLSLYFSLTYKLKAGWGIEGYDTNWLAAHPNYSPFGLIFFDDTLQAAYKTWVKRLLLNADPNEANLTPLALNPAVAMLEIQNEDSLFFATYTPSSFPEVQRLKQEKLYGDWLTAKYGSVAEAFVSWGTPNKPRDNAALGRAELESASNLGNISANKRQADQILFFDHIQTKFYREMGSWLKGPEIGYKGLIVASNWRTVSYRFLQDMEYHSYTAGDVIDTHYYFDPYIMDPAAKGAPTVGKKFYGIPAVINPRRLPVTVKQVAGHPYTVSEIAWDSPSNFRAEAPLMIAAYSALSGIDGVFWFCSAVSDWELGSQQWQSQVPSIYGQFPAAALIYRKGLIAPATTVVREGRTLESLSKKEKPLVEEYRGFDPLRDTAVPVDPNPSNGVGTVDTAAALVGKVEVGFATDNDYTHPDLQGYIDAESGIIKSATGEIVLDTLHGLLKINAPQVRAIVGNTKTAGTVKLGTVELQINNSFAAMVLVALDDLPIEQSSRLLLQTMCKDRPKGWSTKPVTISRGKDQFEGEEIVSLGGSGWETENQSVGRLGINTTRPLPTAKVLDTNGYLLRSTQVVANSTGFSITPPTGAVYMILEWADVPNTSPTIATKNLPIAQVGTYYHVSLVALDKHTETMKWALGDSAPSWLSISDDGILSGTPTDAASLSLSVRVSGVNGMAEAQLPLIILTADGKAPQPTVYPTLWTDAAYPPFNQLKLVSFGWIYDGFFPWVFLFAENSRWLYVPPASTAENLWMYDDYEKSWVWTIFQYEHYYYNANANEWRVF
ncbi:MAG: hypothetical protein SFY80_03935 [Verrucomicrobiota bacterium]|nr:hypothetical protein [Verrucomicrobiota bacterium]